MQLSVIIPAFNVEAYLSDCLDSLADAIDAFNAPDAVEVILVDDGSTDGTPALLEQYARRNAYTLCAHPLNRGLSAARNTGTGKASGDYLVFLDADNRLTRDSLARINELVTTNPEIDGIVLGMELIDEAGKVFGKFYGDRIQVDPPTKLRTAPQSLLISNFLDNFSVLKRSVLVENPYDESLRSLEDWDLWIRLLFVRRATIAFSSDIFGQYRIRPGSLTEQGDRGSIHHLNSLIKIYSRSLLLARTLDLAPAVRQQIHASLGALSMHFINMSGYRTWRVLE